MKILTYFKRNKIDLNNKTLVVAASGGPDSMALVNMLNELKKSENFKIVVAHLDHQLRSDSKQEAELLSAYCQKRNLQLVNGKWPTNLHPKSGIESAAREYRYEFLDKVVRENNGDYLLTAHHGDDLLENILLKLIRSGNPTEMNSLQAVGKMNGTTLLRPLLMFSKAELLEYDRKHHVDYVQDQTNFEDETVRNRLRHHVVPLLKAENKNILQNAMRFSQEQSLIEGLAERTIAQVGEPEEFLPSVFRIEDKQINSFNEAEQSYFWQRFIWRKWHRRVNENFPGYNLQNYQNFVYLWPDNSNTSIDTQRIQVNQQFSFNNQLFLLTDKKNSEKIIGDFWSTSKEFFAGCLPQGTKLLLKSGQHVKAKKKFAEAAIPAAVRNLCLTIFDSQMKPIFVEKTYQDQSWYDAANHYFVYQLRKR